MKYVYRIENQDKITTHLSSVKKLHERIMDILSSQCKDRLEYYGNFNFYTDSFIEGNYNSMNHKMFRDEILLCLKRDLKGQCIIINFGDKKYIIDRIGVE